MRVEAPETQIPVKVWFSKYVPFKQTHSQLSLRRVLIIKGSFLLNPVECFQIVAVDQPTSGLSSTAEINLEVLDYNDNSPQFGAFPDPLLVSEGHYSDSAPGEVHTFLVTDEDAGPNKDITLSFPSPNPLFTLREVSSQLDQHVIWSFINTDSISAKGRSV